MKLLGEVEEEQRDEMTKMWALLWYSRVQENAEDWNKELDISLAFF